MTEFKDKTGRVVKAGDFIVYSATIPDGDLRFGLVLDARDKIKARSVYSWDIVAKYWQRTKNNVWLSNGHRVFVVQKESLPDEVRKMLEAE